MDCHELRSAVQTAKLQGALVRLVGLIFILGQDNGGCLTVGAVNDQLFRIDHERIPARREVCRSNLKVERHVHVKGLLIVLREPGRSANQDRRQRENCK